MPKEKQLSDAEIIAQNFITRLGEDKGKFKSYKILTDLIVHHAGMGGLDGMDVERHNDFYHHINLIRDTIYELETLGA